MSKLDEAKNKLSPFDKTDDTGTGTGTSAQPKGFIERRRGSLPQPDFKFYVAAKAYPGMGYLFVGHSYNVDSHASEEARKAQRSAVIKELFKGEEQWLPAKTALYQKPFFDVLSRMEQDMLYRLPDSALVGPAIDDKGAVIANSFTIWRKEMRRKK